MRTDRTTEPQTDTSTENKGRYSSRTDLMYESVIAAAKASTYHLGLVFSRDLCSVV